MERYKRITTTTTEGSKSDLMVERSSSGGETGFEEPTCQGLYPQRPHEPDCLFYLRTGSCKYGVLCRFNHPPDISSAPPQVSAATSHSKESTVGAGPIYGKIKLFPSAPRSTGTGVCLPSSVSAFSSSNNQNKHTFVEIPKFGSYHHTTEWGTPKTDDPLALLGRSGIELTTTRLKLDSKRWNKKKEKQKWLDSLSPEELEFKSIKLMTNHLKLDSKQWNKKKDLLIHFVLSYPMKQVADQVDCFHLCEYTSKLNPLIRTLEAALKRKDIQILRDSLTELNDLLEVSWNKFCMSNFSSELEVYLPRGWSLHTGQLEFCSSLSFSVYGKPDCPEVILNRAITSSICLVSRCIMEERMKLIAISGHGAGKAVKALKDIPEIQSKFDVVLYISVSQHHSNEEVQMDITKQIHGHEFPPGTDSLLPLDEMLKPYNFLLVLDFIDGRIIDLYNLNIPFDHGCIVLATKSDDIYQIISVDLEIRMEYQMLPWELFSWHVGHVFHPSSTLQETAIRLIEECHGHLLAMILLARALKDVTDVGFWELALNELMLQPSSQVEEGMSQVMVRVLKFIWKSKGNITKRCTEHYTTYGEGRIITEASLISCWLKDCLVETKEEGEVILADLIDSFLLEHFNGAL